MRSTANGSTNASGVPTSIGCSDQTSIPAGNGGDSDDDRDDDDDSDSDGSGYVKVARTKEELEQENLRKTDKTKRTGARQRAGSSHSPARDSNY